MYESREETRASFAIGVLDFFLVLSCSDFMFPGRVSVADRRISRNRVQSA